MKLQPRDAPRAIRKTDFRNGQWGSGSDPNVSRLRAVYSSAGVVLGEFFSSSQEAGLDVAVDSLAYFGTLGTQIEGVLARAVDWSDAPFCQQVTILLRGPNTALPLAPWPACLYNFALKYFTPGYLGVMSIARGQHPSGGCAVKLFTVSSDAGTPGEQTGQAEGEFGSAREAVERFQQLSETEAKVGKHIRGRFVISAERRARSDKARIHSLDEIASAYYEEDIDRDDDRVEGLELSSDVFSSSWAVLDLICQWLSGEVTPLELPLEANAIELVPTIQVYGTRPCSPRDSLWLYWNEHKHLGNVAIRDLWNELNEAERRELSPKCWETIGKEDPRVEVVKQGIRQAKRDRARSGSGGEPLSPTNET